MKTKLAPKTPAEDDSSNVWAPPAASKILMLAQELSEVKELQRYVEQNWEIPLNVTTQPEEALCLFHQLHPDLIVIDHAQAAQFLEQIRQDRGPDTLLPVLVMISEDNARLKSEDLLAGATDFLAKPVDAVGALVRIHNLLALREARLRAESTAELVENAVAERTRKLQERVVRLHDREHRLVQQNRLRALGTMASGVAHDFNNILSVILGFAEQLLRDDPKLSPEAKKRSLRTIITAAEDGAEIVHRLREFHRPKAESGIRQLVDLNPLIEQAVHLTEPKWRSESQARGTSILILRDLAPIPLIHGNPAELREMLTNLVFNAVDAMPNGGTISLTTSLVDEHVVLEFRDTGTGMTELVRRKCLEPFFTTKGERGTGMGLAMVHGIVERHDSAMELESELGRGTLFRFSFPACSDVADSATAAAKAMVEPLHVLVVDDEPLIGEVIAQMLMHDGHTVQIASEPQDAMAYCLEQHFDLVITDKSMPGMSGNDLAVVVKAACPGARVLMVTGFGSEEPACGSVDRVLGKPITIDALRDAIAETLSSAAHPWTKQAG